MKIRRIYLPLKHGANRKEEMHIDPKEAEMLRKLYPNHIPLKVAAKYLGVSPRQLSKLIAEGREPYKYLGGNIGTRQKYVRVYTERLIAYKNGTLCCM